MAQNTYIKINDTNVKELSNAFIGIGGVAKQITAIYIGDENGKAQLCWSSGDLPGLYKDGKRIATWKELTDAGLNLEARGLNSTTSLNSVMSSNATWKTADKFIMSNTIKTLKSYSCYNASSIKTMQFSNTLEMIEKDSLPRNLTSLILPDSLKQMKEEDIIGTKIEKVYFGLNLTNIDNRWFAECTQVSTEYSLKEISVHPNNQFYKNIGNHLYSKDGTQLLRYAPNDPSTTFTISNTTTEICENACNHLKNVTLLEIPNHVTTIHKEAFSNSVKLERVSIPASVTTISTVAPWRYCYSINYFYVSGDNPYFACVDNFKVLRSKGGNVLYKYAPAAEGDSYTTSSSTKTLAEEAFGYCKNLKTLTFTSSITALPKQTCHGCTALQKVTLPTGITSIGSQCFDQCINLGSINNSSNIIDLSSLKSLQTINFAAFRRCEKIQTVILPRGCTSFTSIPQQCFNGCEALRIIKIPSTITEISADAFYYCNALTTVFYEGTQAKWNAITIHSSGNDPLNKATKIYNQAY